MRVYVTAAITTVIFAATFAAWAGGIRVIIFQPMQAAPEGATVIVSGANSNFIDSPEGICLRRHGSITPFCQILVSGEIAQESRLLLRFRYSDALHRLTVRQFNDGS